MQGGLRPNLIPVLRYRDAPRGIEFLREAFGFVTQTRVDGPNGTVAHAQLTLGPGMIMVSSVQNSEFGRLMRQPDEAQGVTQSVYVVVADADEIHYRAKLAGAEIVIEIRDEDYGGRGFSARDPEGHVWSFGTYDPWAPESGG